MEIRTGPFLLTLFVCLLQIGSVSAISCLQCFSVLHKSCLDGKAKPRNCPKATAQFCVKSTGELKYGTVVWRDCESNIDINNTCETKRMSNENVKVCHSLCDTDGCNSVAVQYPYIVFTGGFSLMAIYVAHGVS